MREVHDDTELTVTSDSVYTLAYRFQPPVVTVAGTEAEMKIHFGIVMGLENNRRSHRHEIIFSYPLEPPQHWQPGVSETLGLIQGRLVPEGAVEDSTMLERNIADLVTMYVCEAAKKRDSVVLVMGPPLSKILGRIAYRNLDHSVTIAFFTWGKNALRAPTFSPLPGSSWAGPIPSLHEDALCRTYYSVKPASDVHTRVRLDLFSQYLARDGEPKERDPEEARQTPSEKLDLLNRIIAAGGGFRVDKDESIEVPRDLGMLSRSMRWSDSQFKSLLKQNEAKISEEVSPSRVRNLQQEGILGIEPRDTLAARLKTKDAGYMREVLFAELDQRVEELGLLSGMLEFIT